MGGDIEIMLKKEEVEHHNDAFVIFDMIINALVKRVMIDIRSSTDILYFDAFQKLRVATNGLTLMSSFLTSFIDNFVLSLSTINLHVTFSVEPNFKMISTKFIVVNIPLVYNIIISHPTLNRLWVVVLNYHMTI